MATAVRPERPRPERTDRTDGGRIPIPPLRADPRTPDGFDGQRAQLVRSRWDDQTPQLLGYHRTIEEHARMLAGRQWDVWSRELGAFVDVERFLTDSERLWRQRPVVNLLEYWFMLTHARLTENPPAVTFQPATADRTDRLLADCLTPVFRTQWAETGMDDVFVRACAWCIAAGEAYIETAVDWTRGPRRALAGPAVLTMLGDDGLPIDRLTGGAVPYDAMGQPLAALTDAGAGYDVPDGATPYEDHEGALAPRVRSPLEVRSEWGERRWEDKRWIITRSYLSPDAIRDLYGVEVAPTTAADGAGGANGALDRLLFGSGTFGAAWNTPGSEGVTAASARTLCAVDAMWEQPSALSPATDESPGGRLLIVCGSTVLHDSPRPYRTVAAGPIRRAQFLQVPGRAGLGSTPLEQLVPIQKTYNRGWAQILEHRNLSTNPILVYDQNAGIGGEFSNLPGSKIGVDFSISQQPAYYLSPPPLSADVWRIQSMLLEMILRLGSIAGAEGAPQTDDPSGELVSQLRFNADRPVGVAARSLAQCIAGVAEDWIAVLPTIWTDEKVLDYAGEDEIYRNITITPDLWDGAVNVRPDLENARLEAPESKERRAMAKYQVGLFGAPGTPEAAQRFAEYARNAHLTALVDPPSTPDGAMIRQLMSQWAQGAPFDPAVLQEWVDYAVWVRALRSHLASPEFTRYDPAVQQQFALAWAYIQQGQIAQQLTMTQRAAPVLAAQAAVQGQTARITAETGPAPGEPGPPDDASPPAASAAGAPARE